MNATGAFSDDNIGFTLEIRGGGSFIYRLGSGWLPLGAGGPTAKTELSVAPVYRYVADCIRTLESNWHRKLSSHCYQIISQVSAVGYKGGEETAHRGGLLAPLSEDYDALAFSVR